MAHRTGGFRAVCPAAGWPAPTYVRPCTTVWDEGAKSSLVVMKDGFEGAPELSLVNHDCGSSSQGRRAGIDVTQAMGRVSSSCDAGKTRSWGRWLDQTALGVAEEQSQLGAAVV